MVPGGRVSHALSLPDSMTPPRPTAAPSPVLSKERSTSPPRMEEEDRNLLQEFPLHILSLDRFLVSVPNRLGQHLVLDDVTSD